MKLRNAIVLVLFATCCLLLAACTSNEPAEVAQSDEPATVTEQPATPAPPVEDTTPPAEVSVDLPTEPESEPVELELEVDVELPSPEGVFAGASAALSELESYRFVTSFLFVGEDDSETESGSIELSGAIAGPDAQHFVWEDLEEGERFELVQIGDEAWILDDDGWESVPLLVANAMSQAVLVFAPSVVWGGFFGELESHSTYVGQETVNGISSHHYTSTYNTWGRYWQGNLTDAAGDVWIAEAGYPIKYEFNATGEDEEGGRGSVSWSMEITDVNADINIEPPLAEEESF